MKHPPQTVEFSLCVFPALSPSLPAQHAELVDALNDIPAVSVAVVNLEFAGNILPYIVSLPLGHSGRVLTG